MQGVRRWLEAAEQLQTNQGQVREGPSLAPGVRAPHGPATQGAACRGRCERERILPLRPTGMPGRGKVWGGAGF